jgi:uroporphyrinogen-III synthase
VAFASPSAVAGLDRGLPGHRLHRHVPAVCIGPVTARAAAAAGWWTVRVAAAATADALAEAVAAALAPPDAGPAIPRN